MPGFHHVEIWVADIERASREWGWLLQRVGFALASEWPSGQSWEAGGAYLTLTTSPNLTNDEHDRRRVGLNHLAFHGGSRTVVDALMADAPGHGWTPLYAERYPHAGGDAHYAGWLENTDGFKAEIVADAASTS
ncbi:glyoxalase/bleomycin resistance protein/dioxygenase superfamily protein [Labedella gwakjiensis]|uniref:Glyoxalase n=1 Tax=Labedella gwakjiensis TaxID=390269 RepID=A0A2P8GYU9_9MICO|nr:VOC family protein [Labedella gwakjiensis]PSL39153.1 glyoxalase/bleomycin resistance protein/dioxygenase superfamily protein [Labedella gwakjiensis]RUQ86409.1 glyoxalase [Labedella gwakjiensis]